MYSVEDFHELICEHVTKLNFEWFQRKNEHFKNSQGYSSNHDKIIIEEKKGSWDYEYDDDGNIIHSELIDTSEIHTLDIVQYCSSYLPLDEYNAWGAFPWEDTRSEKSDNIPEFAGHLVTEISAFIKGVTDNIIIYKFISRVLDKTEQELTALKDQYRNNEDYVRVLDEFYRVCTSKLYLKYEKELTLYHETSNHLEKLQFDLTQEELLALIFILQRAGFFKYTDNTPILKYCLNHFLYKNKSGQMVPPTKLKNLQREFSDVAKTQAKNSETSHSGLNAIESRLTKIIEGLK